MFTWFPSKHNLIPPLKHNLIPPIHVTKSLENLFLSGVGHPIFSPILHHENKFCLALNPITDNGVGGVEYLKKGVDELIRLIDQIAVKFDNWSEEEQTRGGMAAWDGGLGLVANREYIDINTFFQDISSDIFSRAEYFAKNGY